MNRVNDSLIKLLSASTGCRFSSPVELDAAEWGRLYKEAVAHQIQYLIFSEANKYGCGVNPSLFSDWKSAMIYHILRFEERFAIAGELIKAFDRANIPLIVLKGFHYKYLYPEPELRSMGDIDLLTDRRSLAGTMKIIEGFGYIRSGDADDPKHIKFFHPQYIMIELHYSLFTEAKRRVAVGFNNEIWQSAVRFETEGLAFNIPSDVNQLIYCCVHMTNHFGKGGFGLRQLSDFNLLVRKLPDDFDWKMLFERADIYGILKFMQALLYVCHELFDLKIPASIIDIYDNEKENIAHMIEVILESGIFGQKDVKTASARSLAAGMNVGGVSGKFSAVRYIFPPRASLSYAYSYAQKYGILLPVAWIHRIINNILRRDLSLRDKIPDTAKVSEYVRLFAWLDIKR